ncbi:hypothetical protein [Spirosoma gilvum]
MANSGRVAGAVSDLIYIRVGVGFAYLSVIMDAYTRKILVAGPPERSFHKTLEAKEPVAALEMALKTRVQSDPPLIHHSLRFCYSSAKLDKLSIPPKTQKY